MAEKITIIDSKDEINLKRAIAKALYSKGFGQEIISKRLKITQPMVSSYINSKNPKDKQILRLTKNSANHITNGGNLDIKPCIFFSNIKKGEYYIGTKNELLVSEKKEIIKNMTQAFAMLKGEKISQIMPKIKINIVMSTQEIRNNEDIASFSDGLIVLDQTIYSMTNIVFGKSKHLASILTYFKKINPQINSIININYNKKIKYGLRCHELGNDFKIKNEKKNYLNTEILFHKGAFGIEPCAYILGDDAVDAAEKLLKIITKHIKK